uniref:Putative secreted protein n=1 Tax=Anopheles triannulatus TaxID=58253 RepID=A0A2M4B597_9DIPT
MSPPPVPSVKALPPLLLGGVVAVRRSLCLCFYLALATEGTPFASIEFAHFLLGGRRMQRDLDAAGKASPSSWSVARASSATSLCFGC